MVFSILILAVSLSIDALGVGIAYGLRNIKIPMPSKLIICLFSIVYAAFALVIGTSLSNILDPVISKLVGIIILLLMGLWIILQSVIKKEIPDSFEEATIISETTLFKFAIKSLGITIQVIRNPVDGDIDRSGTIDIRESIMLGLALSVDAIGVGIGSALAGFQSMLVPFAVGLFQLALLYAGTAFGERFSKFKNLNKRTLSIIPGVLLLLLAFLRIG